jgi:HEPN domain-containing protein
MKAITRQWLEAAHDDLQAIRKLMPDENLTNVIAFHAQQAIEKTLKALLEEKDIFLPKTHDLIRLTKLSQLQFSEHENEIITVLNDLYINTRYPGELGLLPNGKPTLADCNDFIKLVIRIFDNINGLLS